MNEHTAYLQALPAGGWISVEFLTCKARGLDNDQAVVLVDEFREVKTHCLLRRVEPLEAPKGLEHTRSGENTQFVVERLVIPNLPQVVTQKVESHDEKHPC